MKEDDNAYNLATLIYLAVEIECEDCKRRFAEPEGQGEAELLKWSQRVAKSAYDAGWRDISGRVFCSDCGLLQKAKSSAII